MIGLYKAIRDFKEDRLSSFKAFAELCITRQIITAIKTATRQKHIPLNTSVSLDKPVFDEDSDRTLLDVIAGPLLDDPEDFIIHKEDFSQMENEMNKGSKRIGKAGVGPLPGRTNVSGDFGRIEPAGDVGR